MHMLRLTCTPYCSACAPIHCATFLICTDTEALFQVRLVLASRCTAFLSNILCVFSSIHFVALLHAYSLYCEAVLDVP